MQVVDPKHHYDALSQQVILVKAYKHSHKDVHNNKVKHATSNGNNTVQYINAKTTKAASSCLQCQN